MAKNTTDYIRHAITYLKPSCLPFYSGQVSELQRSFFIPNDGYVIPNKLYDDFQLTKFRHASDYEDLGLSMLKKFHLGNDTYLGYILVGGLGEPISFCFITVDRNFNIVDTLECTIKYTNIPVKQFRINENKEVFVYQLVPTTSTSIPLETFQQVDAYITCTVYQIDSTGKFIKMSEKRTQNSRTFTRDELNNKKTNLWDWYNVKY